MRYCFISLLAVLWVAAASAPALGQAPGAASKPDPLTANLSALEAAGDSNDWETLIVHADALIALEEFSRQPAGLIGWVTASKGYAHWQLDQLDAALEAFAAAEEVGGAILVPVYYWRGTLHYFEEDWRAAQQDFVRLAPLSAEYFSSPDPRFYFRILNGLEETEERTLERDLLEALTERYEPELAFTSIEGFRLRLARILAREGEHRAALVQFQSILSGQLRASMRTEIIFEPLWSRDTFDILTDVRSGAEASLARAERDAQAHPDYLEPVNDQIEELLVLGRFAEAEARAQAAIAEDDRVAYYDSVDHLNWTMNLLANALYAQGKVTEGNRVMAAAAQLEELGMSNVSQVINLASIHNGQGRHSEALDIFAGLTPDMASPYGNMWIRAGRACAMLGLNRHSEAQTLVPSILEDWRDNAAAAQMLTLCLDDHDSAVALMVERLGDQRHAPDALAALQEYQSLYPRQSFPFRSMLRDRFDRLRRSDDVLAAVDTVGRIERFEIVNAYWGGY